MHDKIFISYAKEDINLAIQLYDFLEANSFSPWLDKKDILPGQDWNFKIKTALREANYMILLLSNNSVQKRGYVQREFKAALDFVDEKLDDDIYLISIKIDDCLVPDRLSKYQWVEYDNKNCFNLILSSLNLQRDKYLDYDKKLLAANQIFQYEEVSEDFIYGTSHKFSLLTKYCRFLDTSNQNLKELNNIIKGKQAEFLVISRKQFHLVSGEIDQELASGMDWFFEVIYSPNLITKSIISISENYYNFTGGAHGNGFISSVNYHLNPLFIITIEELFDYNDHDLILNFLSDYSYKELQKLHNDWLEPTPEEIMAQTKETLFWEGSLAPKWENFNNFFISKTGLEIIFNSYSISSYAFGVQIILVPYDLILLELTKPQSLKQVIAMLG